mmetsp:Transcript_66612/g.167873  ORF Transcript_66612/g.167873 Transcript_66612/m.167873 type:complete len:125 (-) Transcript_66612:115-489(-)
MKLKSVAELCEQHKEKVDLLHVYITEAHAKGEWELSVNSEDGVSIDQPKVLQERLDVAAEFAKAIGMEGHMVVDDMTNSSDIAYETRPERLYVIDSGKIVWRSGLGPFQYDVKGLAKFLETSYG